MPTVEVTFTALPAHVRTARLIATAVARRAGVPDEFLDEVRLAVGEACSRAVGLHQRHAPSAPVGLSLSDDGGRYSVVVSDIAPADEDVTAADLHAFDPDELAAPAPGAGPDPLPDLLPPGFGLAVIAGLVDDVAVTTDHEGTTVRMSWPAGSEQGSIPAS